MRRRSGARFAPAPNERAIFANEVRAISVPGHSAWTQCLDKDIRTRPGMSAPFAVRRAGAPLLHRAVLRVAAWALSNVIQRERVRPARADDVGRGGRARVVLRWHRATTNQHSVEFALLEAPCPRL